MKYLDFHVHSNHSDGEYTPNQIYEMAASSEVRLVAICDHDSISGINDITNHDLNVQTVNGVEISTDFLIDNRLVRVHILGYGFDHQNHDLLKLMEEMKSKRIQVHNGIKEFMRKEFIELMHLEMEHIDVSKYHWYDRAILKLAENYLPHMEEMERLRQYLKHNKMSYGSDYAILPSDAIDIIHRAGGLAVLAHPMSYKLDYSQVERLILSVVDHGIDGIEVYQSDCSALDSKWLLDQAAKHKLLTSVGSDFHRTVSSDNRVLAYGIGDNLRIENVSLEAALLAKGKILERKKVD